MCTPARSRRVTANMKKSAAAHVSLMLVGQCVLVASFGGAPKRHADPKSPRMQSPARWRVGKAIELCEGGVTRTYLMGHASGQACKLHAAAAAMARRTRGEEPHWPHVAQR